MQAMNPLNLTNEFKIRVDLKNSQAEMVLTDVRFLLREYLKSANPEYLKLMSQSLGVERFYGGIESREQARNQ